MTVTIDQEYKVVPIDSIREHPQNANVGDEALIDESIDVNGWYGACIVQKSTGYIIAGNHRWRVAKRRGADEIPAIFRDVDDQTALRIMLVDNESTRRGHLEQSLLDQVLESLETLEGTGYGLPAGEEVPEPETGGEEGEDDVPDDVYTPSYGIMVVCRDEEHQAAMYDWLQQYVEEGLERDGNGVALFEGAALRVVAV